MKSAILTLFATLLCAVLSAQETTILSLDFEKPLTHGWYVNGKYNTAKGFTGNGVLFAQENLGDFAQHCPNAVPMGAAQCAFNNFPTECGYIEVKFLPYFNQNRAYPKNPNNNLKLYYLMQGAVKDGQPASFNIYRHGEGITASFRVKGNSKENNIILYLPDTERGKWQTLRFSWTPEEKTLTLNGKSKTLKVAGPLQDVRHFKLGGVGNNLSIQAIIDDLKIVKTTPPAPAKAHVINFTDQTALNRDWELIKMEGGEGFIELDNSLKNAAGHPTLKITKTNGKGYLVLQHKIPQGELKHGTGYRLSSRYHSANAQADNYLLLRMPTKGQSPLLYETAPNSGWVYPVYSYITHSVPGQWQNNLYYFFGSKPETPRNITVVLGGSACSVNLENLTINAVNDLGKTPYPEYGAKWNPLRFEKKYVLSEADMVKHVQKRQPAHIETKVDGRSARFFLNGKQEVPVIYFVQAGNPRAHYHEMNKDAGVNIFLLHCAVKSSDRYNILKKDGTYDFSKCTAEIISALRSAPDATLILKLTVGAYPGLDATPDEIWQNRQGKLGVSESGNMLYADKFVDKKSGKEEYYPSYASKAWMKTCGDAAEAFINHLKQLGVFNAFAGIQLSIGEDGQFLTWYHKQDFSPAARRGFSDFLRKKYGTVEKLRAAWHNPKASFDFPTRESMPAFDINTATRLLDPAADMPLLDAMIYHNEMQITVIEYFAKRMEAAAGRKLFNITMAPGSLLKSWIDQVAMGDTSMHSFRDALPYVERRPGRATANTAAYDTTRSHGIVTFNELDIRTYASGKPTTFESEWNGYANTPDEFRTILRKLIAPQVAKGMGFWYFDMNQYFAQEPAMHKIMKQTHEIAKEVALKKDTFTPDVAVILDHNSIFYNVGGFPVGNLQPRTSQMNAYYLNASGVPFDMFYLRDVLRNPDKLKPYKTIIFCSTLLLDDDARKSINALKANNRTLVWLYTAGLMDGKTPFSASKASELMGINVVEDGTGMLSLTTDGRDCLGFGDFMKNRCFPHTLPTLNRYAVNDNAAQILGKFLENGKPAIAKRTYPNWTSIYIGAPDALSDNLMNRIAKENGSFVAVDKPGAVMAMRNNFVSLHALRSNDYVIKFPQKGNIVDPDTGKVLAANSDTVTLHLNVGETRWLIQR